MKVLVADDHWIVRAGLKHLLVELDDVSVIEAANFEQAMDAAAANPDLDLVLMDLLMPGASPFAGLQGLLDKVPSVPVIVISVLDTREDVLRAIEVGAMGFTSKKASGEEILAVIKRVLAGEIWVPSDLVARSRTGVGEVPHLKTVEPRGKPIAALTGRQREVFNLLAQGKSNRQIAHDLGVSEHTVRVHISAILKTLDVENRTQAAVLAAEYLS